MTLNKNNWMLMNLMGRDVKKLEGCLQKYVGSNEYFQHYFPMETSWKKFCKWQEQIHLKVI